MLTLKTLVKGLLLLRYPEIVRDLGERRFRLQQWQSLKEINPTAKISRDIIIQGYHDGLMTIGDHSTLEAGTIICFGEKESGGSIKVGSETWIGQYNNLRAGFGEIHIGSSCLISQFCTLVATNHGIAKNHRIKSQAPSMGKIVLEDDIWLGCDNRTGGGHRGWRCGDQIDSGI